ncbi:MAG TPA: alpha/beta hydrolase [Ktedonobacteraceae bacterium]|nr:alpha/beta hydrolase [Ktedonobacteraceae bacterium]
MNMLTIPTVEPTIFYADVAYIENLWRRTPVGKIDLPIIDIGEGVPLVFVPVLEHLEFIYARQIREFSQSRRVILYRRREVRTHPVGFAERTEELCAVLDSLGLECVDLIAHGDAAMVLLEFAIRYPQRCRSLIIIAQGADYQIAPHPFIWLLHEIFVRLPVEHFLPAWFLRRIVINYIVAHQTAPGTDLICRLPRNLIEEQFRKIALWPFVYKFSVLPIIHYFDIRDRLDQLTMPILLINREDDVLAPEPKTHWFSEQIPDCAGYHVIPGGERFFLYSQAEIVNQFIANFLGVPYTRS